MEGLGGEQDALQLSASSLWWRIALLQEDALQAAPGTFRSLCLSDAPMGTG